MTRVSIMLSVGRVANPGHRQSQIPQGTGGLSAHERADHDHRPEPTTLVRSR
jgi:hypothetical protein